MDGSPFCRLEWERVVTEQEWLVCHKPDAMVKCLRGKVSDWKLRLFAVASCRWAWDLISPENRQIVENIERRIDQPLGEVGMGLAALAPLKKTMTLQDSLVRDLGQEDAWEAGHSVAFRVARLYWSQVTVTSTTVNEAISRIVAEVFGNPFHPVTLDSALRKPGIVSLAESAYAERTLPSGDLDSLAALRHRPDG
jgi:hypothetical protein